uniref:Uncharacterized protein n=1 Tax=Schizaphis graminum TaxID=13262 RepID=A0A2S2PKI7_SCHGA
MGGPTQGAHVRHGPVERAETDGTHGRRLATGTRTRPVAVSSTGSGSGLRSSPAADTDAATTATISSSYDAYFFISLHAMRFSYFILCYYKSFFSSKFYVYIFLFLFVHYIF